LSESQSSFPLFNGDIGQLEKRLWESADQLRANSNLSASEYSNPILGLIFLRYADHKFTVAQQELEGQSTGLRSRAIGKADFQARGVMYLPEEARFSNLLNLPKGENVGLRINDAMRAVELENVDLKDVLPKTYNRLENGILLALLRNFAEIPMDVEGDVFGRVCEYFLGKFAMSEGQRGGEFFTPTSIVKLIVEVIEPYHGRILDPACGSGGMFVQSARFVANHQGNPNEKWAKDKNATFIRLTDTVERDETFYLKSGAKGRWSEAPKETFDFIINRNKEQKTTK
jgi:type I restriction enzyme M protein